MVRLGCFFGALLVVGANAFAAGGGGNLPAVPIERSDYNSLQRGAAAFVNYCSGCHSAVYLRYGRIGEDLGIGEDVLRANLMGGGAGLASGIESAMPADKAAEWFGQAPPDLSLSAKLRGNDWLYAYLRGFYRDADAAGGWNNTVFENVAMPHVLAELQGEYGVGEDGEKVLVRSGRLSPAEYDAFVVDLVNFMDYMAEPARGERYRAGYVVLSLLLILLVCAFFLYREYWRDIY